MKSTTDKSVEVADARRLAPDRLRQTVLDLRRAGAAKEREAAANLDPPALASARLEIEPVRLASTLARVGLLRRSAWADGAFLNVWSAAGLERDEVRNTRLLAWWLDPQGSHGLGGAVLSALLARVLIPLDLRPP